MGNASQYFPIKDKLFTEINMSLKVLGIVVFISIFMVQGNEAATATCEFGPMDVVEDDIKGHIIFRQADAASSLSINVRGIEGLKTGFHGFHFDEELVVPGELAGLYDESPNQIIGRTYILHELEDDLGQGGDEGSETTGNAGTKLGCCVITAQED